MQLAVCSDHVAIALMPPLHHLTGTIRCWWMQSHDYTSIEDAVTSDQHPDERGASKTCLCVAVYCSCSLAAIMILLVMVYVIQERRLLAHGS